jgi:hypothetical protein
MIDGETSVMMMMKISSKSPSRQGARTEFLVPNRGFSWWRRSGTLSGKNAKPPIVSGLEVYVGERRARGGGWGVAASQPLSVSSSGSVGLLVK